MMVQWTKPARQMLVQELVEFKNEMEKAARSTLDTINYYRMVNGLRPKYRIDKEVLRQTIINLTLDTSVRGDIENKDNEVRYIA